MYISPSLCINLILPHHFCLPGPRPRWSRSSDARTRNFATAQVSRTLPQSHYFTIFPMVEKKFETLLCRRGGREEEVEIIQKYTLKPKRLKGESLNNSSSTLVTKAHILGMKCISPLSASKMQKKGITP